MDAIPLAEIASVRGVGSADNNHSKVRIGSTSRILNKLGVSGASLRRDNSVALLPTVAGQAPPAADPPQPANKSGKAYQAFLIQTIQGGYNSGREYHFRSEALGHTVVADLREAAAAARWKAVARTRFRQSQEMIRLAYESSPFQFAVALLIIVVRARHGASPRAAVSPPFDTGRSGPGTAPAWHRALTGDRLARARARAGSALLPRPGWVAGGCC